MAAFSTKRKKTLKTNKIIWLKTPLRVFLQCEISQGRILDTAANLMT
jgi:hypothetical protein